jgi:GntR family transcriptional repressor for pyruvate dehydrogenase complex
LILSGELPAGYEFPNENEMCTKLNVGRSTLREAYRALQIMGLIHRTRAGTRVNSILTILESSPLDVVVELADFRDLLEFRQMLEGEAARCTALKASEAELKRLRDIIEQAKASISDYDRLQKLEQDFHLSIVEFSHNILIRNTFLQIWNAFRAAISSNYSRLSHSQPERLTESTLKQHESILCAIEQRDGDLAKTRMIQHIESVFR